MGYNGPAPGNRWENGNIVSTQIVREVHSTQELLKKIPQPGDPYIIPGTPHRFGDPCGPPYAGRPTRIEWIRPSVANIDIPYYADPGRCEPYPKQEYTLQPKRVIPAWAFFVAAAIMTAYGVYRQLHGR